MAKLELSAEDRARLEELEPKHQLVRDRVYGVAQGIHPGLYLWGPGGTSKSYTALDELEKLEADHVVHNSRMTGRGLVDALHKRPSSVHVIEDCESMFDDRRAWGVLRSALWSQSTRRPMEREITWTAFATAIRFTFTGGIVLIANKPLEAVPGLAALATRSTLLQLGARLAEISAPMRSGSLKGFVFGRTA